jgi:hypothetical protein
MNLYHVNHEISKAIKLIDNGLIEDGRDVLVQTANILNRKELLAKGQGILQTILKQTYFVPSQFNWVIDRIAIELEEIGFDSSELRDSSLHSNAKYRSNVKIGYNYYLTLTWHQMPSGRFELIGYIS